MGLEINFIISILILAILIFLLLRTRWFNNLLNKFNDFIEKSINLEISTWLWIISYISITLIRDFLENFIGCPEFLLNWAMHFEFSFFGLHYFSQLLFF